MLFRRRRQTDFSAELKAHLELEQDRLRAEGLGEQEAYQRARKNLGNLAGAEERFYESSRWLWLEHTMQDARHALRRLRKAPAFAITAILMLALGIGATTSIFTLAHAVLLKSLPVSNPAQLYRLGNQPHCCVWAGYNQGDEFSMVSYQLYQAFRDNSNGFEQLAAFQAGGTGLGIRRAHSAAPALSCLGKFVSGNYFTMFGLGAYAGRTLTADDDRPGAPPVAVMSYHLWQQKYGLDPAVIGAAFNVNDKSFTIVGVTPPSFYGDTLQTSPPDLYLPLTSEPLVKGASSMLYQVDRHWLGMIGRIRPDARPASIEAQMRVELHRWLLSHSGDMNANNRTTVARQTLYLTPGGAGITNMRSAYKHWLQILMLVSGFVLLIVCANMANLTIVRGLEQRGQSSLSVALGARPSRLIRQALTESVVLSLLGGAGGVAVAFAGTRLILYLAFPNTPGSPISASPSLPVLLFAFGVSLITGIGFGIAPAWLASQADPIDALRGANRATRRTASLPRRTLVILQASLSLVLLCASGLLTEALQKLQTQDMGFHQQDRVIVNIDPLLAGYKPEQLDLLFQRIHESLAALPGVSSVAFNFYSPQSGDSWNDMIYVAGRPAPGPSENNIAWMDRVSPGFFEAIGNPLLQGRTISERDTAGSRHVAVINQAFARKFFPKQDPIGKRFGNSEPTSAGAYEVVGVVKDARWLTYNYDKPVVPFFFLPESQTTSFVDSANNAGEVRSHYLHDIVILLHPGAKLSREQVSQSLAAIDPRLPVVAMQTMREQVARNFSQQRLIARLTSLFGFLALILASIGIYGITSFNVGSRTSEIGVRMALGADRGNVLRLILSGALVLIAAGLVLGVPLSLAVGGFLGNQLYGIDHYNPLVIASAILALGSSAFIAALIPAIRASSISPLRALRAE